jgi:hypothetical protein
MTSNAPTSAPASGQRGSRPPAVSIVAIASVLAEMARPPLLPIQTGNSDLRGKVAAERASVNPAHLADSFCRTLLATHCGKVSLRIFRATAWGLPRRLSGPSFAQRMSLGARVKSAFVVLVAFCAALATGPAAGAELPSRPTPGATRTATTPAAKTCQIDGQAGIIIPGSDTCLHIGGSVGAAATMGGGGGSRLNAQP